MKTKVKNWNLLLISFFCIISTLSILYHVFKFTKFEKSLKKTFKDYEL
jgi:hypothetical protein